MEDTTIAISESGKIDKEGLCLEDYISGLPNDVIGLILSLLTMKEAGRTSVMSKRWRYIWTCFPSLNFDDSDKINKLFVLIDDEKLEDKELEAERVVYLNWINQVLKSYHGPTIDQFRVQLAFDVKYVCDDTFKSVIDNWVLFAMEKRVKRLDLDFTDFQRNCEEGEEYTLDSLSNRITSFNLLTILRLKEVNVSGQLLEFFFTHCPFLEQVYVEMSHSLVNLKVPQVARKLKNLDIIHCFNVESIEIFAVNVVSFKYFGDRIEFPFKNDQLPSELFIGGLYCDYLIQNFLGISSYLSHLESLTLEPLYLRDYFEFEGNIFDNAKFPIFNKLKQLELRIDAKDDISLLPVVPLIEGCPFIHKFVLQLRWSKSNVRRKRQKVKPRPNCYLKEVELIGFVGGTNDVELLLYLIKRAVTLEKIIFDTRNPLQFGTAWEWEFMESPEKKLARKIAYKLGTKLLPYGAALEIV